MQTFWHPTVVHNSAGMYERARRALGRSAEDTINLDTGRIKCRIYSPDTKVDAYPVPALFVPCLLRVHPFIRPCAFAIRAPVWVGSSVMATIFLYTLSIFIPLNFFFCNLDVSEADSLFKHLWNAFCQRSILHVMVCKLDL